MKTILLSIFACAALQAAPVNYAISFTNTSGPDTPISGGFTYDAATGVVSNLVVAFTDRTYFITNSTGAFQNSAESFVCGPPYRPSGDAAVFSLLSQSVSSCSVTDYYWLRRTANAGNLFLFDAIGAGNLGLGHVGVLEFPTVGTGTTSYGEWTITAVPEPTSMSILGAGIAAFGLWRQRRRG